MIDKKAFHSLSYGLYIITTEADGFAAGCVCNTFQQVTSDPMQVSVALNKQNATTEAIRSAGRFAVSVLAQDATSTSCPTISSARSAAWAKRSSRRSRSPRRPRRQNFANRVQ